MPPKDSQQLPGKEAALFRQVVKFYETKQYKKGIKAADQILKKFPEHGETLAMKGLICNCMEKKEEAYDLVRKGLKAHLQSHVCWHVYGLLYRSDRNYDEAIKCYKNALRQDKENLQILRDLAQLQVQMRDMAGFVETRYSLLQLKPANRAHWIAFAVAHHLEKNYEVAVQVLDAYANTLESVPPEEVYGYSEMLLYKATVLQEAGMYDRALEHLAKSEKQIRDRLSLLELRGALLLASGDASGAEKIYRTLLAAGPDNHKVHHHLQASMGLLAPPGGTLTDAQRTALKTLYKDLAETYPRSNACRRLPLDFLEASDFEQAVTAYIYRHLEKGIPALFVDLRPLYTNPTKRDTIGRIVSDIQTSLEAAQSHRSQSHTSQSPISTHNKDDAGNNTGNNTGNSGKDGSDTGRVGNDNNNNNNSSSSSSSSYSTSPQMLIWTWAFRAQHEDYLGNTGAALTLVEKAIDHTPTVIELHSIRSKVLKHAGDPQGAAAAAEQARCMDLADRYLNCTAVRRLFRAGDVEGAERLATLFTKDGDQINNLFDMQCMWYEIEAGNEHLAKGQLGRALKKFRAVVTHFNDFAEDQFDFHTYCIRKMTLRSYVELLRMEDRLYGHKYFFQAACGAIECYIRLYDSPPSTAEEDEEAELAKLTPEERRRAKQKRKKEAAKAAKAAEEHAKQQDEKRKAGDQGGKGGGGKKAAGEVTAKKVDPDPHGVQLAATPNPLEEATKLLTILLTHSGNRMRVQELAFEVYMRKGRLLLALRAVKHARALGGADDPTAHTMLVRLIKALTEVDQGDNAATAPPQGNGMAAPAPPTPTRTQYTTTPPPATVRQVIDEQVGILLDGCTDHVEYNAAWTARVASQPTSSLKARVAAASMAVLLDSSAKGRALDILLTGDVFTNKPPPSHAACAAVEQQLRDPSSPLCDAKAADTWHARCQAMFQWSSTFDGKARAMVTPLVGKGAEEEGGGTPNGRATG